MLKVLLLAPINIAVRPFPTAQRALTAWKAKVKVWLKLRYFVSDVRYAKRYMFWSELDPSYSKLSSELLFQYHKLEKGLCIGGPKRFFGLDPVQATCGLVERWRKVGFPTDDPIFIGALETLRSYRRRLIDTPAPVEHSARIHELLNACLGAVPEVPHMATPKLHRRSSGVAETFDQLCRERRSVRAYSDEVVPLELLNGAITTAQFSPSACNRQPWRIHVFRDKAQIKRLLELQSGNAGFGHQLSTLLIIAADGQSFFDASERHEPYLDTGLFVMSLILALQARGLASCCLNWCVSPELDRLAHERGDLPEHERIVTYLAVGYAAEGALVPLSARRALESMTVVHGE
jgi:nitroreductase